MPDLRPINLTIGALTTILGLFTILPTLMDLSRGNQDWVVFFVSSIITLFAGVSLLIANRGWHGSLNIKEAFILTTLSWVVLTAFAALPFSLSALKMDFTDAYFEAMSGITTTGATVMVNLDVAPPGILLWRSLLQWIGGIGIIVTAIAILPMLRIGGMQLFRSESSDTSDKIMPKATQISISIFIIYIAFTIACIIAYYFAGMSLFDAINHSLTTVSIGGFSTHDKSLGYFDSLSIEFVAILFMILGCLPFVAYLRVVQGNINSIFKDTQIIWFLLIVSFFILVMFIFLLINSDNSIERSLRYAAFNVMSILTGTGYATDDYSMWSPFAVSIFFCIAFIGGCSGSASCGIKVFRFQIIYINFKTWLNRMILPNAVLVPKFGSRKLTEEASTSVMSFFVLFFVIFGLLALCLNMMGLNITTSLSAATGALANVGPGLGQMVGPAGNYSPIPDLGKWLLSFAMLLGRLDLFTVLVLFRPSFWKN